jgi:hypothetical protein
MGRGLARSGRTRLNGDYDFEYCKGDVEGKGHTKDLGGGGGEGECVRGGKGVGGWLGVHEAYKKSFRFVRVDLGSFGCIGFQTFVCLWGSGWWAVGGK